MSLCDSRFRVIPTRGLKKTLHMVFPRYFRGFPFRSRKGTAKSPSRKIRLILPREFRGISLGNPYLVPDARTKPGDFRSLRMFSIRHWAMQFRFRLRLFLVFLDRTWNYSHLGP